ncbi:MULTISPECIES: hypothetical protein [Bradyrhizobium]|uniref:hypothetical protein n=1 Tax=Bradyrhizobium TaxID=374 RepID=UPI001EDB6B7F|nr:hypothetical protein [Bradyrhizobium zhengyangense]MCG2645581.1 hypothetical protein [Bradyrhizobium zhengyangense]
MPIAVWFDRKDTGVPDRSIAVRYFETADLVLREAAEHRAGPMGETHRMRIAGAVSMEDDRKLRESGIVLSAGAYLPKFGRVS